MGFRPATNINLLRLIQSQRLVTRHTAERQHHVWKQHLRIRDSFDERKLADGQGNGRSSDR